jgi:SAM-dependent methyltransferase
MNSKLLNPLFIKVSHFIFRVRKFQHKHLRKLGKTIQNKKILEIGSGDKTSKPFFDESNDFLCSDIFPEYGHPIVDVTTMTFEEEFDVVVCLSVLEHVFEFQKAYENMYRALKNGGVLILSFPGYYPFHAEPHDYWRFTEHSIRKLLSKFREVKIYHRGIRQYPFVYFILAKK